MLTVKALPVAISRISRNGTRTSVGIRVRGHTDRRIDFWSSPWYIRPVPAIRISESRIRVIGVTYRIRQRQGQSTAEDDINKQSCGIHSPSPPIAPTCLSARTVDDLTSDFKSSNRGAKTKKEAKSTEAHSIEMAIELTLPFSLRLHRFHPHRLRPRRCVHTRELPRNICLCGKIPMVLWNFY